MWRARKTNSENLSRRKIYFYWNPNELSNFFFHFSLFVFHFKTRVMNSNRRLLLTQLRLMMTFGWAKTNHLTFWWQFTSLTSQNNSSIVIAIRSAIKSQTLSLNLRHSMIFCVIVSMIDCGRESSHERLSPKSGCGWSINHRTCFQKHPKARVWLNCKQLIISNLSLMQ